jgi:hypothetical protein
MLVHNKGDYVRHIGVRLIPGVNNLPEAEFKEFHNALNHPLNKYLVEKGEIVIPPDTISNLGDKEAISLIKDTFALNVLDGFNEEESNNSKRKTVLKAIEQQIESIKNPPEDKIVKDEE